MRSHPTKRKLALDICNYCLSNKLVEHSIKAVQKNYHFMHFKNFAWGSSRWTSKTHKRSSARRHGITETVCRLTAVHNEVAQLGQTRHTHRCQIPTKSTFCWWPRRSSSNPTENERIRTSKKMQFLGNLKCEGKLIRLNGCLLKETTSYACASWTWLITWKSNYAEWDPNGLRLSFSQKSSTKLPIQMRRRLPSSLLHREDVVYSYTHVQNIKDYARTAHKNSIGFTFTTQQRWASNIMSGRETE